MEGGGGMGLDGGGGSELERDDDAGGMVGLGAEGEERVVVYL